MHFLYHWLKKDKYYLLLFTQLLFFGLLPVFDDNSRVSNFILPFLLSLILIAGINAIQLKKMFLYLGIASSTLFIFTAGLTDFSNEPILTLVSFLLFVSMYGFVIFRIVRALLTTHEVKISLIAGALAGYLMIGVILSFFFIMIIAFSPDSLKIASGDAGFTSIVYYSLVTMTTIGYGDIVPIHLLARIVSVFGAIASQFYLAVVVAILVGKLMNKKSN